MTVTLTELGLYAFALAVLVLTPGPVVVATIARTLTSGWRSAMPLAAGVSLVDMLWPLLAILGLEAIAHLYGELMQVLRYVGAVILIWMGWRLVTGRTEALQAKPDASLMHRDAWQGFMAGLLVNLGNPKSIFFFAGVLPSFFTFGTLNAVDVTVIVVMSAVVPFLGNCVWAAAAHRARTMLKSAKAVRRVNQVSGGALIGAGAYIGAT